MLTEFPASAYGKMINATFTAPIWAKNAHIQTIYPKYFIRRNSLAFERKRVDTPDGDFLDLGLLFPANTKSVKAVVVLFHGLEGSQQSHYIQHLSETLYAQDMGVVVMHFRGCSGELNRTVRAYHSGETTDARFCIDWIKANYMQSGQAYESAPLFAVGFSLGGNMLLKLLGEKHTNDFSAAVSVSAPIDLSASSEAINKGFARQYQAHLLRTMQQNVINKMAIMDLRPHVQLDAHGIKQLTSFRLFDEYVTSKLHGFVDADDYYAQSSAMPFLTTIDTPTLVLHAADDPFMDARVIPKEAQLSQSVAYELSQNGGHVGFMHGNPFEPSLWLPSRISAFFQEFL
jgi:predicted alpha/beta-fold hydrolase